MAAFILDDDRGNRRQDDARFKNRPERRAEVPEERRGDGRDEAKAGAVRCGAGIAGDYGKITNLSAPAATQASAGRVACGKSGSTRAGIFSSREPSRAW
jgi:hypothetical protein